MKFLIELVIVAVIAGISSAVPVLTNADCGLLLEPAPHFVYESARQVVVDPPTQQHLVAVRPVQQVLVERPYLQQVVFERPTTQQVVVERPTAQQIVAERPTAQQIVAERPTAKQIVAERPIAQQIVVEHPTAQQFVVDYPTAQQVMGQRPHKQQIVVEHPFAQQAVVERQPIVFERQCSQPIILERQFAQPVIPECPCSQSAVVEEARPVDLHVRPIVQTLPVPEITIYENSTNNPMSSSNSYTVFNFAVPVAQSVNEVFIAEPEQIVETLTVERSPQIMFQPPAPTCVQCQPIPVVLQTASTSYTPSMQSPPAIYYSDAILQTPSVVYHPELVEYQTRIPCNSGIRVY